MVSELMKSLNKTKKLIIASNRKYKYIAKQGYHNDWGVK